MTLPVRCGLKVAEGACTAAILAPRRPRRAFGAPLLIIGRSCLALLICLPNRCKDSQARLMTQNMTNCALPAWCA